MTCDGQKFRVYALGSRIVVETATPFHDARSGEPLDPDEVRLTVTSPDGQDTTWEFGGEDAVIQRVGVGRYEADIDADQPGMWVFRWWATGDGQAADTWLFGVRDERGNWPL